MQTGTERFAATVKDMMQSFNELLEVKKVLLVAPYQTCIQIARRNEYLEVKPLSMLRELNTENAKSLMRTNFIPVLTFETSGSGARKYYNEAYCVCYVDTVEPAE